MLYQNIRVRNINRNADAGATSCGFNREEMVAISPTAY